MAPPSVSLSPLLLAIAGQFLFGIILALPGTLFGISSWTTPLALDIPAQARMLVIFFTGQLTFTAAAGALVDRAGCERVLAGGAALLGAAFFVLSHAATSSAVYATAVLLAAGGASVNAATNTLVSISYGSRRGAMLSVMALFGGVGALVAPLLFLGPPNPAGVATRLQGLAACAVLAAVAPLAGGPRATVEAVHSAPWAALGLLRDRWLVGLVLLLLLDFGVEAVLAGWTAVYAITILPGSSGTQVVALYWAGLIVGRMCAPWVLVRSSKLLVVLVASALVAISVTCMAFAQTLPALIAAVTVAGFGVGPLAPTIVAVAGDRYPRGTGSVLGLLLSMAQLGGMIFPWVQARIAVEAGLRVSLAVPIAGALAIAAGAAAIRRRRALTAATPVAPEAAP